MDPLSIITGIIAVIGAGGTVSKRLRKLAQVRHAPKLIIELKDEVSDLYLLVESSANLASQHESVTTKPLSPAVARGLEKIQNTLLALERLIVYDLTTITNSDGQTEVDKLAWVRSGAKIQELKWQMQDGRQYLSTALGLLNVSTSLAQIEHQRSFFRTIETPKWAETKALWTKSSFANYNNDSLVSRTIRDSQPDRSPIVPRQLKLELLKSLAMNDDACGTDTRPALPQVAVTDSPTGLISNDTTSLLAAVSTASLNEDAPPINNDDGDEISNLADHLIKYRPRIPGAQSPSTSQVNNSQSMGALMTEESSSQSPKRCKSSLHAKKMTTCRIGCQCSCHRGNRLRSPQVMTGLVGSLSANYSIRPSPLDGCVSEWCRSSTVDVEYVFPRWLTKMSLEFSTILGSSNFTSVSLKSPKFCSESAPIFWAARTGAIDHIRRLFSAGEATRCDINYPERKSALHIAMESMQMDVAQYLLHTGADPFHKCSFGSSAFTAAATILYGGSRSVNQCTSDKLRRMFESDGDRSLIDHLGFAPMHLACVVPTRQSLDMDLVYADLDKEDNTERTALSWVAQRGNPRLLNVLLHCGADPNRRDSSGRNTLHWAVLGRNVSCVESLIRFGADIFAKDKLGSTLIHLAVQGEASLLIVQTLLSLGADLRARDGQGMTPLHLAAYYDQPSIVSRLLGNGASINDTDSTGRTALHIAISLNNYGVLRLLLCNSSLQCNIRDNFERSVVHFAACLGDICTLRILTASHLKGLSADDRDNTGVTGIQYAQWRLLHNEEWSNSVVEPQDPNPWAWYDAFTELNMRIRHRSTGQMAEQSAHEDPHSWESLEKDLAGLDLSEDDENTHELDSEDEWDNALEVLSSNSNQGATSSTTSVASPNARQRKPRSDDPSDEIY